MSLQGGILEHKNSLKGGIRLSCESILLALPSFTVFFGEGVLMGLVGNVQQSTMKLQQTEAFYVCWLQLEGVTDHASPETCHALCVLCG